MHKALRAHIFFHQFHASLILFIFLLLDSILNVPVNTVLAMAGWVFLGLTSTMQGLICLAQGHNTVTLVKLELATTWTGVKRLSTEIPFLYWIKICKLILMRVM